MPGKRILEVIIAGDPKGALAAFGQVETGAGGLMGKLGGIGGVATIAGTAIAAGLVGAGTALFKLGSDFDEQFDKIRVGTGATGEALKGLEGDFKQVLKDVPTDFGSAGTAIADINTRLGLTGKPLQQVSEQFLELSRITGDDVGSNIEAVTGLFNQFGVAAGDQSGKLDALFRASQATGISVGELASQVSQGGPVFQALGFSVEQATGMVASLGKAGLSASDILPGLSKVLAVGAKEGKSATDTYRDLMRSIKEAPDATSAAQVGFDALGAKAGPKFAQLVRSGQLSSQDLFDTIAEGTDTIIGAGKDTQDFGEKWQLIKNRVLVALEPLATRVFSAIGSGMDALGPVIDKLSVGFSAMGAAFSGEGVTSDGFVGVMERIGVAARQVVDWVRENWPQIKATITSVLESVQAVVGGVVDVITTIWRNFGDNILAFLHRAWDPIAQIVQGVMEQIRGVIMIVTGLIHGDWSQVWDGIKMVFAGVWDEMVGKLRLAIETIKAVLGVGLEILKGIFSGAWSAISSTASGAWNGIIGFFRGIPGKISDAFSGLADMIKAPFKAGFDAVKRFWNSTVGGFGFSVPSWVPFAGGKSFHIPKMALGGIVTGPTLAMIGEGRGPEAVVPLDRAGEFGFGGRGGDVNVYVTVQGSAFTGERDLVATINEAVRKGLVLRTG